jgi:hypothetical protein
MIVTTLAPPAAEPAVWPPAKEYRPIGCDGEDELAGQLIAAARARTEEATSVGDDQSSAARDPGLAAAAVSRQADGVEAETVMALVRAALAAAEPEMDDWTCILLTPAFTDTTRRRVGERRALLRLKAIVESA